MIIKNIVILLWILNGITSSDLSTCSFSYIDTCNEEKELLCTKPTIEGKCDNDFQLEMSSGDSSFESVEGELVCDNEQLNGGRKGGFKLLDIDAIRCAKEKCTVNPSKGIGKCMPSTACKDATATDDSVVCDVGYHIEIQQTKGTSNGWIEVKKMKCSGDIVTVEIQSGTIPSQSMMNIRCRKDRVPPSSCDISSYFDVDQCDGSSLCTKPNLKTNGVSCDSGTLQGIIDEWKDVTDFSVQCNEKNLIVMMKDSIAFEPQLLRCREHVCENDLSEYKAPKEECPKDDTCTDVISPVDKKNVVCENGQQLEGQVTAKGGWNTVDSILVCSKQLLIPNSFTKLRCHLPRPCNMDKFYDEELCDRHVACKKPDSTQFCETNYKLEYSDVSPPNWSDAVVICSKNQYKISQGGIPKSIVPIGFRCVKERGCDLSNYEESSCEDDNECIPPKNENNELKCDPEYELQTKEIQWIKVQKVSCVSNVFEWKNEKEGNVIISVRCVRKNLTKFFDGSLCNTNEEKCEEPSIHSNLVCEDKFNLEVKNKDEKWTNVKEITANSDKFTVKDMEDKIMTTQPEKIRCVRNTLCTRMHPLKSLCEGNDLCEIITFKDDVTNKCKASLVRKSKNNTETRGLELYCDRTKTEWKMKTNEGDENVNEDDNVYCENENCRPEEFCLNCENDQNKYYCPKGVGKVDEYKKDSSRNFNFFTCVKGKWYDGNGMIMQDTDKVKCEEDGTGSLHSANIILLAFIIILIFVIIIIAILLAYIVYRLQGKGWLHTIVIAKIRGDKKKKGKGSKERKEMKSGKKGYKGESSGKGAIKNTEKETSNVEPDIPSSAEPVKISGEKISAEGLSVTGASAEKLSSENIEGGGGIAIPNGSNEPIDRINPNVAYA